MTLTREAPTLKVTLPYTVEQANRTLPLVRRIVADLADQYRQWEAAVREVELTSHHSLAESGDAVRWQQETQRLAAEVDGCVRELAELGIEVRAFDVGHVEFPGTRDGRDGYFSWTLGETEVTGWREGMLGE